MQGEEGSGASTPAEGVATPDLDFSDLKKKKKKAVAFTEDPLGAEADPTTPAPDTIDNTTTAGEHVDLGPSTAHEQMKAQTEGEDDLKAMFGDVKKKKKNKKDIPLDLVRIRTQSMTHI